MSNGKYKIGTTHTFRYTNPPVAKENQYLVGQLVKILDDEGKLLAQYQVIKSNQFRILGKVTNTYGHKRRRNEHQNRPNQPQRATRKV